MYLQMEASGAPQPAPRTTLQSKVVVAGTDENAANGSPTGPGGQDYQRCRVCTRRHALRMCSVFKSMQPQQRYVLARAHGYCTNCLALSHHTSECSSSGSCRKCNLQHHTLLHRSQTPTTSPANNNARRHISAGTASRRRNPGPVGDRIVKRSTQGLHTTNYRGKVTRLLVQEALRAIQELQQTLDA
ncbi:PREDICTED: uncharacterized protein LOC108365915 [Rhagoletis zephyria]|uniref:uncharacterized protein LOC108365915 n=1 Tax=Rhagoletis zephyria TaxID=28612 RepID=UPI00081168AA|nr:PREDICTED: uncharacterized protein LOC108365915 [Rhagoletis zephyria]